MPEVPHALDTVLAACLAKEASNRYSSAEELAEDEQVRKVYLGKNFELRKKKILDD